MKLYKDILSGDEMFSDTYKMKLVDDVVYEVYGKYITRGPDSVVLAGANASAEEEVEGTDDQGTSGVDIVINHRLVETGFDKKGYTVYIKDFMKKIAERLKETNPDQVDTFKTNVQKLIVSLLKNERFKELQFFTGEKMDPDGLIALMEYRDIDGVSTPVMMFFKHALEEEKL